jgi:hypothetical protein
MATERGRNVHDQSLELVGQLERMHDAAIFVSIEARFRGNSELLQESATLSEAKRASQASRFIDGQVLNAQ